MDNVRAVLIVTRSKLAGDREVTVGARVQKFWFFK